MSLVDLRNRAPEILRQPDSRIRVQRVYDVINFAIFTPVELNAKVWLPWGTQDEKYPEARLVLQQVKGQQPATSGERGDPSISPERTPPILIRVYDQIDQSAETQVGEPDVTVDQSGLKTVTINWIQFSTGTAIYSIPGTTTAPAPWSSLVLQKQEDTDDGTLRTIKRTYIESGVISVNTDYKNEGALEIQTIKTVGVAPSTPVGFTLISTDVQYINGSPVFTYQYAKGNGVIEIREQQRDGGLRLVTWVSLGPVYNSSYMLPPGVLVLKDTEAMDGTYRFTVACMQSATGGDPTSGTALSWFDKHPFRYPGRAKAYMQTGTSVYTITSGGGQVAYPFAAKLYDVFLSPPVDVELDAEITVNYQTSPALSLGTAFWNPDTWATMEARYQQNNSIAAISEIKSLSGFRAVEDGVPLDFFASTVTITIPVATTVWVTNFAYSCLGQSLYPLSDGFIVISGGPESPDDKTWILAAHLEPAFVSLDGVQYFRRTQVSAYVPAQTPLPV